MAAPLTSMSVSLCVLCASGNRYHNKNENNKKKHIRDDGNNNKSHR